MKAYGRFLCTRRLALRGVGRRKAARDGWTDTARPEGVSASGQETGDERFGRPLTRGKALEGTPRRVCS